MNIALLILQLVPAAIRGVSGAIEALEHASALIRRLQAEDRDPTDAEIADLRARVHAVDDAIQAAARE